MAAPGDQRIAVPIDDPNADTEWNDILRKHGVIPEKPPSPTPMIEEAILEGRRLAHENRLEGKDLDELDELEDVEDEAFIEQYRQKRMAELRSLQNKSIHGSVYPISKPEYQRQVTEASRDGPVFVNLTSSMGTNAESARLSELWRQAASEYGDVKFCEIRASQAIENYPDKNCPTILVYKNGDIVKQVVTLMTLHGVRTTMRSIDNLLVEVGAVPDSDMRVIKRRRAAEDEEEEEEEERQASRTIRTAKMSGAGKPGQRTALRTRSRATPHQRVIVNLAATSHSSAMEEEPCLPQLPSSHTRDPKGNIRKRGRFSTSGTSTDPASSSDPFTFSSDDNPGLDNDVDGRRKRRYHGPWFKQQLESSDLALNDVVPQPSKRTLTRHLDSGVFCGSDVSEDYDLPEPSCIPSRVRFLPLPPQRRVPPAEQLARDRIRDCVDKGRELVDLMNMNLQSIDDHTISLLATMQIIPNVSRDVAFVQQEPQIDLFLGQNSLTRLPGALFQVNHLTTLSLRGNNLSEISPAIANLTNLKELNLAQNQLRSLPSELLRLLRPGSKLQRFFWGPNPLYDPDCQLQPINSAVSGDTSSSGHFIVRYFGRSPLQLSNSMGRVTSRFQLPVHDVMARVPTHRPSGGKSCGEAGSNVASLVELCLRSGYSSSELPELHEKMPRQMEDLCRLLQRAARQKAAGGLSCSKCRRLVIVPTVEWIEWHEVNHWNDPPTIGTPPVAFQYRACSWGCRPKDVE
ncbi:hypothetical protein CP533_3454 [Ophiocordyceps camponoti-saundersi (nom. inval.)]|nr:hypothetical protein CP533_3454 [Ophiocordyceps camponoti-saundersi (nom. inval.)]